jgi:hypothetical protein
VLGQEGRDARAGTEPVGARLDSQDAVEAGELQIRLLPHAMSPDHRHPFQGDAVEQGGQADSRLAPQGQHLASTGPHVGGQAAEPRQLPFSAVKHRTGATFA